jgi:hypothetical protein
LGDQQPAKTERVDFSYKPLPEDSEAAIPTGGLGSISGGNGDLGSISVPSDELVSKDVFSRDTVGFQDIADSLQDTLFRHQVWLFT